MTSALSPSPRPTAAETRRDEPAASAGSPAAVRPTFAASAGARWLKLLCFVLGGLALLGRTFAYFGVPPFFISELTVLIGLGAMLLLPKTTVALTRPVSLLILALLGLTAVHTFPYLAQYKLDAIRDAMISGYGLVALIVAAVLLSQPDLLPALLRRFRSFARVFLMVMPGLWLIGVAGGDSLPTLPWAPDVSIVELKPGDMPIHLGAIAALTILGLSRLNKWYFTLLMCMLLAVTGAVTRSGLVAFLLMFSVAFWIRPQSRWAGRLIAVILSVVMLAALANLEIQVPGRQRSFSAQQIVINLVSVVSNDATEGDLDDTKEWRLNWWKSIIDYTFYGDYFWRGKGFGVNLANSDGFQVELEDDGLRSPHNGHLTFLARAGVPGLALWVTLQTVWIWGVANAYYRARKLGDAGWAMFFAFLIAYWAGLMFNATFDVYFEGPMGGMWFWTIIGIGIAAPRLYVTHPHLLRGPEFALAEPGPERTSLR